MSKRKSRSASSKLSAWRTGDDSSRPWLPLYPVRRIPLTSPRKRLHAPIANWKSVGSYERPDAWLFLTAFR